MDPDSVRALLSRHEQSEFPPMKSDCLRTWLQDVGDHPDDLHIVIRSKTFPCVTFYDTDSRQMHDVSNAITNTKVVDVMPEGMQTHDVYMAPPGLTVTTDAAVRDAVASLDLATLTKVARSASFKTIAPWGFVPSDLHLILAPEADAVEDLLPSQRRDIFFDAKPFGPPSSESEPLAFSISQQNKDKHIIRGRPDQLALPPSLLDETLAQLRHNIDHIEPTSSDIQCYAELKTIGSVVYDSRAGFHRTIS
ncbi:hypothetical protein DAEQUDRAFT_733729 [Daedalea quercina L-15889]|uniref:Uncharacterized protein n=1 Tax=Daedalea quercina L-15889 TaxID=1314783 RepID=A0A165KSR5_9APHY|nr:hypothetical protein DAEQUDRAFT_733729 [Daedalea quercina L-15889]